MHGTVSTWRKLARLAFSLIEVNMAILVVAGGVLTLITLFPAGLRMSMSSIEDTRIALFAGDALNSLAAQAAAASLDTWKAAPRDFWAAIAKDEVFAGATVVDERKTFDRQRLAIEGEVADHFSGRDNDARLGKVPVRYRILLERRRESNGQAPNARLDSLNQHLDFMTWRFSLAATDKPGLKLSDIEFDVLPVYHLEVRYGVLP